LPSEFLHIETDFVAMRVHFRRTRFARYSQCRRNIVEAKRGFYLFLRPQNDASYGC